MLKQVTIDRFWSRVEKADGCWKWLGKSRHADGYGRMRVNGKHEGAHRIAWLIAHGEIPEGMWVLHRCDNPECTNPAHLFLGTHLDNIADKVAKGRQKGAPRQPWACDHPRTPENTYASGSRERCKTCLKAAANRRYAEDPAPHVARVTARRMRLRAQGISV